MDHNPQSQGHGRRNFHRGRRGSDRRGNERRGPAPEPQAQRSDVDVEQIMRDIRAGIAQRNGIELSNQQIQELAARRLESILDPRTVRPALLDQLRRAAGAAPEAAPADAAPAYSFEDQTLYESHSGLTRAIRRLLQPVLKLFFNPNPLIRALNIQARLNTEHAKREAERDRRQAEWNALHYELVQRLVTEIARLSLEGQSLALKVEALSAKVDFNERRVRTIEGSAHQPRQGGGRRDGTDAPAAVSLAASSAPASTAADGIAPGGPSTAQGLTPTGDAPRRRRRRRRGRRSDGTPTDPHGPGPDALTADDAVDRDEGDDDDTPLAPDDTITGDPDSPAVALALSRDEEPSSDVPVGEPAPAAPPQTSSGESPAGPAED